MTRRAAVTEVIYFLFPPPLFSPVLRNLPQIKAALNCLGVDHANVSMNCRRLANTNAFYLKRKRERRKLAFRIRARSKATSHLTLVKTDRYQLDARPAPNTEISSSISCCHCCLAPLCCCFVLPRNYFYLLEWACIQLLFRTLRFRVR